MTTNRSIRWGLLGTGNINKRVIAGALQSDRNEVTAVASRSDERSRAYASEHGIARAYGAYEMLLEDPDVDAVYISLPNGLHHSWTMASLAAGKHVLCEKPYTRNPEEVDIAWDAADAAGLVLMEAFMWRHTPQTDRLVELLPRIGELTAIRSTFGFRLEGDNDIRLDPDLDGGSLMDVGCYCVSAARLIAGANPDVVFGQQVTSDRGIDRSFTGMLHFPSGVTATFHSSFNARTATLEAIGTDGTIVVPDPWHSKTGMILVDDIEDRVEAADPYRCELDDMAAAIHGERQQRIGRDDALGQARTIEALYRSAAEGRPIPL